MLGDNAYYHGTDNEYQRAVFNTYPQVLPRTVLWPTLGNHDGDTADSTTESGPYYDIFSLPRNGEAGGVASGTEAYYSFDYGNMHFICLDSYGTDRSADGAMMTWLEADLAANDKEWVIAFWHVSPYSKGNHDSDREDQAISMRQNAVPLLERYGVDLVLTGHTHSYERSYLIDGHYGLSDTFTDALKKTPGDGSATGDGAYRKPATVGAPHAGAVYVVAGNAGLIKTGGSLDHPAMPVSFRILGSMVLDVNGNRLDAKFLGSTGDIWDAFTILKLPEVSGSVAENTAAGEEVVTVAGENPEDDRTYTLAGASGNSDHTPFTITAGGELQTRAALDYEQPADADGNSIYEVVVSVEDGEEENGNEAGTDDSVLVTIHVTDMDEAGTVSLPPDPPQALTPLTARLDDPDRDAGHTVSWQWASSANRTGPWTAIGGATAPSYTPQASDVTKYLRATATYQDRHARNQSAFSDASAQVTAHAQSVAPEITSAATFTVDEGTTEVETLTAEDQDSAAADLEWSKAGGADAGQFMLSTDGDLAFATAPDYENPDDADGDRTYEITVQVSDGDNTDTADIRVTLQNVLELFTELEGPSSTDYAENGATRVATYIASSDEDRDGIAWSLGGDDAGHFSIDNPAGVLRFHIDPDDDNSFPKLPDYEAPDDKDEKNDYAVIVLARSGSALTLKSVIVTVTDEDEAGAISLTTARPKMGDPLTAMLTDPDGVTAGTVMWQWERSAGRNVWVVIDGATEASYMPTAADTNAFLRVTTTYTDGHGAGKSARAVAPYTPLAHQLSALSVTGPARGPYPAFDPKVLHYAMECAVGNPITLTLSAAKSNTRMAVNGVLRPGQKAVVKLTGLDGYSDIPITLTGGQGGATTYVLHCFQEDFPDIATEKGSGATEELIGFSLHLNPPGLDRYGYLVIVDNNGVPRVHRRIGARANHFRPQNSETYPFSYSVPDAQTTDVWVLVDRDLNELDRVTTVLPLISTDRHDFIILDNGDYLLLSYEPVLRDFSSLTDGDGNPLPENPDEPDGRYPVLDTAIQIRTPAGAPKLTWYSWDHMAAQDCGPSEPFPSGDWAHGNSLWMSDGVIVASFRPCGKVVAIDAATGDVVWRLGRSYRTPEEWGRDELSGQGRGTGPAPMTILNDPYGEFCGQHSAQVLDNGHVLLYDNGLPCVVDPATGLSQRESGVFSRAVEYAIDPDKGEAIFQRHHSLHGNFNRVGRAAGLVEPMDNGDWLVSWGRGEFDDDPNTALPPDESVTQVDPDNGTEKFSINVQIDHRGEESIPVRAYPLSPVALADTPSPLRAEIAESSATSVFHLGPTDAPKVVVAFNQPVVDPDPAATTWPWVNVQGATVESVNPHIVPGDPANTYLFTLTPTGVGPITFALVAGHSCASDGICTADGTVLTEVSGIACHPPPDHRPGGGVDHEQCDPSDQGRVHGDDHLLGAGNGTDRRRDRGDQRHRVELWGRGGELHP